MDSEGILLIEISQIEKNKYGMISLVHGIYKTQQSNEYNKKKISRLTDMENKLVVNNAEGGNLGVGD